jgi:hypothetical protein
LIQQVFNSKGDGVSIKWSKDGRRYRYVLNGSLMNVTSAVSQMKVNTLVGFDTMDRGRSI